MPASLSNQIRLGFSLGWRIWTPNEVGFYAKTLAHSYFIFTILKAKFFTKKLWVVNYSIFVAAAKYLVFVEFIEFGIKTKEERTYWKKIMYISLLIRHAKYKSKLKYTPNFEKMKTIGRFFRKILNKRGNFETKPKIWSYFQKILGPAAIKKRDERESHIKNINIVAKKLSEKKNFNLKFNKLHLNNNVKYGTISENKKAYRNKVKNTLKREFVGVALKLQRTTKWSTNALPKKEQRLTVKQLKDKKLNNKISKVWYNKLVANTFTPKKDLRAQVSYDTLASVLGRKIKKKEKKEISAKRPVQKPIIRIRRLDNERRRNVEALSTDPKIPQTKLRLKDRAELIFAFQSFIRKRHEVVFSVTGGPRKRLFRNIKRSFQGKFIVHYASLVWFWEKISRLITYIVKKLTQSTVSAFRIA